MPIPTRDEWKALVAEHGYKRAVAMVDCDLDDIPGIEETWLENFEAMRPAFEESQRKFFEWLAAPWWRRAWWRIVGRS